MALGATVGADLLCELSLTPPYSVPGILILVAKSDGILQCLHCIIALMRRSFRGDLWGNRRTSLGCSIGEGWVGERIGR